MTPKTIAEAYADAARLCQMNAVQSVSPDAMPTPIGDACWSHVGQKYATMILARAAEVGEPAMTGS